MEVSKKEIEELFVRIAIKNEKRKLLEREQQDNQFGLEDEVEEGQDLYSKL